MNEADLTVANVIINLADKYNILVKKCAKLERENMIYKFIYWLNTCHISSNRQLQLTLCLLSNTYSLIHTLNREN